MIMQSSIVIKQILDLNKKAFDDSFRVMVTVQEHTEKMVRIFCEKSMFFPEEGKTVVGDWILTYKNGLDEFKANADRRFKLACDYLLHAADQVEASFNTAAKQAQVNTPAVDQIKKKASAGIKKAVALNQVVKKEKIRRKRTSKQK